jgi:segregation and condensation protein B
MSLKAKLEAVIYAAEEPVTLGQLAALFADEALEWKAQQVAAAEAEELAPAETENLPLLDEALAEAATEPETADETAAESVDDGADMDARATVDAEAGGNVPDPEAEAADEVAATPDAGQSEAEARRAARMRDREARGVIKKLLDELIAEYAIDGRGVEIREIAGGYRMATKPECHDAVRLFIKGQKPPLKLSLPALETLAVIAYKQPVTAPEVNEIRGVYSSAVFGSLLARKLIATAGRKPVVGRPILYKTTREFLLRFGLKDVSELPSMEEFEKMAASELDETEIAEPEVAESEVAESAVAEPELAGGEAPPSEDAAEFNPDLSVETNGNGTHGETELAAESTGTALDTSNSKA